MIVEYVHYTIPEAAQAAFATCYADAGRLLSADPHCLEWELRRCVEMPAQHVVRIVWDSIDGHESGFRQSDAFVGFIACLRQFQQWRREMAHYDLVVGGGATA